MLQQILFFRELGFRLKEIQAILSAPGYDRHEALSRHRMLLLAERSRLDGLIALVESTIQGENTMEFKPFERTEIEEARAKYAAEARERWGTTAAYAESEERASCRTPAQWLEVQKEADAIFDGFAALSGRDPAGPEAQAMVRQWQEHISRHYYVCTREILAGLGEMYAGDARFRENLDRHGPGTADLMSAAIAAYCGT